MRTIATLFSGGELVGVGARMAGLTHLFGIEYKDEIAAVARLNGFSTITADVTKVDPHDFEIPDILHASPVCTRASQANTSAELNEDGTKEHPLDIAAAESVVRFLEVMKPKVFTLENVYAYRNFKAFKMICRALERIGYIYDFQNLNSADFGVPQIRRRLILRATRVGLLRPLPPPETPRRGWYHAVEDLLPACPETEFAPWQLARIPQELKSFIIVTGNTNLKQAKAGGGVVFTDEPVNTIMGQCGMPKAFLYAGQNTTSNVTRLDEEPAMSITGFQKGGQPTAFLLGQGERNKPIEADDPSQTITSNSNQTGVKAFIVDDQNGNEKETGGRGLTIRGENDPMFVVSATQTKRSLRPAVSAGRVVAMTPRCLARFQTLPDDYILPDKNSLACLIIGNGVPCLMYQKILETAI